MSRRPSQLRSHYISFGTEPSPATSTSLQAIVRSLIKFAPAGLTDVIPGYTNLLLEYDTNVTSATALNKLVDALRSDKQAVPGRRISVPVRYDGPDLGSAAEALGMSAEELVNRHSAPEYLVHAIGFTPGFPFMGILEPELRLPRRKHPRPSVPANSVAIADLQTGIYPLESPGGWHLLGTALKPVYNPHQANPFLLEPGDLVNFVPTTGKAPQRPQVLELLPEMPRNPVFKVLKAGLLDLIVDSGRFSVGRYGLARSGPTDPTSARIANALVGNPAASPVLEMNLSGPLLEAQRSAVVAFAGWGVQPQLNKTQATPRFMSFSVKKGDVLRFPPQNTGAVGYLAIAGGIEMKSFMNSASLDVSSYIGRALKEDDMIGVNQTSLVLPSRSFVPHFNPSSTASIRLVRGPQYSPEAAVVLQQEIFKVHKGNRMGVQLDGAAVPGGQVISEGNPLGAIQVTSGGQPIILMQDRGTIGGYAKPAIIHPADLTRIAQMREGQKIRFRFLRP